MSWAPTGRLRGRAGFRRPADRAGSGAALLVTSADSEPEPKLFREMGILPVSLYIDFLLFSQISLMDIYT